MIIEILNQAGVVQERREFSSYAAQKRWFKEMVEAGFLFIPEKRCTIIEPED